MSAEGASLALGFAAVWKSRADHPAKRVTQIVALTEGLQEAIRAARSVGVDPTEAVQGFLLQVLATEDRHNQAEIARVKELSRMDSARALLAAADKAAAEIRRGA